MGWKLVGTRTISTTNNERASSFGGKNLRVRCCVIRTRLLSNLKLREISEELLNKATKDNKSRFLIEDEHKTVKRQLLVAMPHICKSRERSSVC